jgi:hypothetical protein
MDHEPSRVKWKGQTREAATTGRFLPSGDNAEDTEEERRT